MLKQPFLCALLNILFVAADDIWMSFKPGTGYGNRNEFIIEEAVSDETFVLGKDVYSWKSIKHQKHAYAVGLMPRGLTIIKAGVGENKNRFNVNHTVHDLQQEPMSITLHGCWNKTIRKTELILAVAAVNKSYEIDWYKIRDDLKMEKFWTWSICKKIYQIEFYKQNRLHKLLMITEDDTNHTYADTYEFSLQEKQFWLTQSIPLANPTKSSAVSTSGPNYYLSIPQKTLNSVLTFKYFENHFVPFKNISCKNADFVASFKVSFKSYLAVAGDNGGIFEFHKNTLRKIEVEGSTLNGVKFWFPIPVNNFREEVVLLVQRRIETETHDAWHLEAVLHNENKFTLHEEFHCKFLGEELTGLRCMADEDRKNGIIGLTTLSVGQTLGLLVPRAGDAPSGLLMFRTDMKSLSSQVNDEIKKIEETKVKLEELLERRKKAVENSKIVGSSWTSPSSAAFQAPVAAFQEVEWIAPEQEEIELKIKELELGVDDLKLEIREMVKQFHEIMEARQGNRFDTVVFNGNVRVEGSGSFGKVFAKNINNHDLNDILNNAARPENEHKLISNKRFEELKVENLYFENIDGIPNDKLVFADGTPITLKGDVVFKAPVRVESDLVSKTGKVNEVMLEQEVVTTEKNSDHHLHFQDIKLRKSAQINNLNRIALHSDYLNKIPPVSDLTNLYVLNVGNLFIPVDMNVKNVNGENFDGFLSSLVKKDMHTQIPGSVLLEGDLHAANVSTMNYLNGNKFPEDFLLTQAQTHFTKITGNKLFVNTITAKEITSKLVNGIHPKNIITLSKNQTIPATVKFENLEITERLIVDDDKVVDENLLQFRPSLTLEETNIINSNVNFQHLEIDGILTVIQDFNGTNFESLLNSVIYKDDPMAEVDSVKEFPLGFSVANNLDIKYNAINNISLDSFVLRDTDEPLQIKKLKGSVIFNNLYLNGRYGGINVTKLDEDTVKTFGEQYLSSNLHFEDLFITKLFINETLNDVPVENYLFIDGDRVFEGTIEFESVVAQTARVLGKVEAPMKNFNIKTFDERRLSHTKEQLIVANYTIALAHAKRLVVSEINGIIFVDLFGKKITAKQLTELARKGGLKIKDLFVNGSLHIDDVNGVPATVVLENDVLRNKANNRNVSLLIKANARFGHVTLKNLDTVDFDAFTKEIIFKNESHVWFSKDVIFTEGVTVLHNINTKTINGIPLEDLARNNNPPTALILVKNLRITSDVAIENINGFPMRTLGTKIEILDGILKVKNDVTFKDLEASELRVRGSINGIKASDSLANAVFLDKNAVFEGRTIFQQPVEVRSNFGVKETVDKVNLPALMASVVLKTKDGRIPSTVVFAKPVVVEKSFNITGNLYTEQLDGCDVEKWKENALFVNKGLLKGKFTFDNVVLNEDLQTEFVNNLDMNYVIPLRFEQQISELLQFEEVSSYHNVSVGKLVNKHNLKSEFANTLMNGVGQTVHSKIVFQEEAFAANVEASGIINGVSLKNIVTTYTDQTLTGSYNFSEVSFKGNLHNNGSLSGLNFNDWYRNGLKKHWPRTQKVNGRWTISGSLTFAESVEGNGRINGLELSKALEDLEGKKLAKYAIEKDVMRDYTKACEDVNHILRESKKQIHSFKYFELMQITNFALALKNVHHFTVEDKHYLLVSEENNCLSHLFVWNDSQFVFTRPIETGLFVQTITVKTGRFTFLVTRSTIKGACTVYGTNMWIFQNQTLKWIKLLKTSQLLRSSRRPGAFYSIEPNAVVEYRIIHSKIRKYRKWPLNSTSTVFVPRGLNSGLALISDNELVKLLEDEPDEWYSLNMNNTLNGAVVKEPDLTFPVNAKSEMVSLNVGILGKTRTLIAFATQEDGSIEKGLDLIKVYEDIRLKRLFQNIPTYKPSSLTSIELENGETLLIFLEDGSTLQVYEYKGIEGFKRRSSTKFKGNKLFVAYLGKGENKRTILGVVDENKLTLLDALMMGNKLEVAELDCEL